MISPNDTTYAIVRETVPGTTPATPAFRYFDYISGNDLTFAGTTVSSDVMRANRATAAASLMNKVVGNSLKTHARRDTTTDMLIEAAICGAFTSNVAKGGNTDFSHTIERKMIDKSSGSTTNNYYRYRGTYVSKMALTVDASSNAEYTFDFVGMDRSTDNSLITGVTYAPATQGLALTGLDVGTVTIGGITGIYTSLDLTVESPREGIFGLGSSSAVAVGASPSPRTIKLTAKMLRNGIAVDALAGTTTSATFTIGSGVGNQYIFALPKCLVSVPQDEIAGAAAVVSIELTALDDPTAGTDITVTKA